MIRVYTPYFTGYGKMAIEVAIVRSEEQMLSIDRQHILKRTFKKQKKRLAVVYWLWILTGLFGGYHYYLRHYVKGSIMTLIFIFAIAVGWFTWYLLLVINAVWALHDLFYLRRWYRTTNQQLYQKVLNSLQ